MNNLRCLLNVWILLPILLSAPAICQTDSSSKLLAAEDTLPDNTPVFTANLDDIDASAGNLTSGLLQSSRDVFTMSAAFNLSASRFRIRGYNADKMDVFVNGAPLSDLTTGWNTFYKWGGLNDLTRYSEAKPWLGTNPYHFGGLGGYSAINVRASNINRGHRVSYALTNRDYRHRLMYTYGSGMNQKGWAFAMSLSARYAAEGYVEGTFYESWSYYLAVEKKLNSRNTLSLSAFGAPRSRGRSNVFVQETYDLTGDVYYNADWGWQTMPDGSRVKRNSNIAAEHIPVITLSHQNKINEKFKWNSTALVSFGKSRVERLNWYDAADPRPDYYRHLPSYYSAINDAASAALWNERWVTGNSDYTQINWDQLYRANDNNLYSLTDAEGQAGNTLTGKRAKYITENQWDNELCLSLSSVLNKTFDKLELTGGLYYQMQRNHTYKTIADLMGADFWVDVDQFAEAAFLDPLAAQNNLSITNNAVHVGEEFGYNYFINNHQATGFLQSELQLKKIDLYAAVEVSDQFFYREGVYQNGRFPTSSQGKSSVHNFLNIAVKGGVVLKLSGRQFITLNGSCLTEAPTSSVAFISPRTRNSTADLVNEQIYSWDVNYILRYPKLKMRLTWYHTERKNAIWSRSFYHDEYRSLVNYVMTGVDYLNQGLEFGIDGNLFGGLSANGIAAVGQHLYTSRPVADIFVDNSAEQVATDRLVYLTNFKIGGMPQSAFSAGLKYSGKKYWFAGINFNYFIDIYLDPNPERRTAEAVSGFAETDPQWAQTIDQKKLPNGYNLTLSLSKSFKIGDKYLSFFGNITNLTNNKNFITGGYEQLRYDKTNPNKFPEKVAYMYGLSYFMMATLRF